MHYLSLGAIFRSENHWLDEWICYHRHIGVEHFLLYNNDPDTSESDRILRPYTESGLVENIRYPGELIQMSAYRNCLERAVGKTRWLALIDLDEFLLPRHVDDLRELLQDFESFGGLAVNWCVFGSNGHVSVPPGQINHFLRRSEDSFPNNRFVKCIVKPDHVDIEQTRDNPHCFPLTQGMIVNERRREVRSYDSDYSGDFIRLNHYVVRSLECYWHNKVTRGLALKVWPRDQNYWNWMNRNDVFDDEISQRFGHLFD